MLLHVQSWKSGTMGFMLPRPQGRCFCRCRCHRRRRLYPIQYAMHDTHVLLQPEGSFTDNLDINVISISLLRDYPQFRNI